MHFTQLVRAHGIEGTAQELGVSGRTIRRARDAAMTPAVEGALARHIARTLTVREAPWRQPFGTLDQRLGLLEQAMKDMREQVAAQEGAR
ncbi:MAG: hypothetical protein HY681_06030, partial [Chloroflexi bacterium]|nr:hypothetical protein [Chloroflexota bacterium]